jgi:phosphomevalonate kinase
VLEGGIAVVMAVSRYARAEIAQASDEAPPATDFVAAALAVARERYGLEVPGVRVDTSAFLEGSLKLGLGSSAATVAVTLGAVLAHHGRSLVRERLGLLGAAQLAHARAQASRGAAGSGADVAASVMGGLIAFQKTERATRAVHLEPGLLARARFVWSGQAADTPGMIQRVSALREEARSRYDSRFRVIQEAAVRFLAALEGQDPKDMIATLDSCGTAMAELGDEAGVAIVTPAHRRIRELFRAAGGAAKPSGAGGGDLAVGLVPEGADFAALDAALLAEGLTPLDLGLSESGLGA